MRVQMATPSAAALREAALGLGVYAVYLWTARGAGSRERRARARRHARWVAGVEARAGIDVEPAVQRAVLRHRRSMHALSVAYALLNVALTVGWLVWLFRARDPDYARLRRAAVAVVAGAAPVFRLFPCAPPRTTGWAVDTIAEVSGVDLESPWLRRFYNPLAAMPSIHVAFAVVAGWGIAASRPSWRVRAAGGRIRGWWRRRWWRRGTTSCWTCWRGWRWGWGRCGGQGRGCDGHEAGLTGMGRDAHDQAIVRVVRSDRTAGGGLELG